MIVAVAARQAIVAGAAIEQVVSRTAIDEIVAVAAEEATDEYLTAVTRDVAKIVTVAAIDGVVAVTAVGYVSAGVTVQKVISRSAPRTST